MLDEEQATYLITLMKNSEVVRKFKRLLVRDFYRMRRMLSDLASQHQNADGMPLSSKHPWNVMG